MSPAARKPKHCSLRAFTFLVLILTAKSCHSAFRAPPMTNNLGIHSRPMLDLRPELSSPTTSAVRSPPTSLKEARVGHPFTVVRRWLGATWSTVWNDLFFRKASTANPSKRSEQTSSINRLKKSFRDFCFGVSHVFQHYTSIWILESVGAEIVHTPIFLLLKFAANACPPFYRSFRNRLVGTLILFDKLSLAFDLVFIRMSLLFFFYSGFGKSMPGGLNKSPHIRSACFMENKSSFDPWLHISTIVEAPIIEEVEFRLMFHSIWKMVSTSVYGIIKWRHKRGAQDEFRISNTTKIEEAMLDVGFRCEPWVISSSILFGIAHVHSWMPLNKRYFLDELAIFLRFVPRKDEHRYPMRSSRDRLVLNSVYQSQHALVASLILFAPLYQHRGVMASIGAHSVLNLIATCIPRDRHMLAFVTAVYKSLANRSC